MRADGIWVVKVASVSVRQLSAVSGRPGSPLDWSPDGSRVLLVTNNSVVIVSTVDGAVRTLVAPPTAPAPGEAQNCSDRLGSAGWSPDGRWVAYEEVRCVLDGGTTFLYSAIPIMSADGVWQYEINNMLWGTNSDFGTHSPVWSPDSRFLAFIDDASLSQGETFLEVASRTGANNRRLKAGVDAAPAW
jgi:Tol biopolymer transport system component